MKANRRLAGSFIMVLICMALILTQVRAEDVVYGDDGTNVSTCGMNGPDLSLRVEIRH